MADSRKPVGVNFGKILQSLQGDVQEMKTEYEESCIAINDDNKHLHQFCDRLEFIFSFGLNEGSSFLSGRRDLWQYFCKCLANRRNIHDGLKIVKANTELKTSKGRFRCFVRYCLVHQCLGDVVQQCVDNHAVTSQFYQDGSPTRDALLLPTLLTCLYQLCDLPFDLPPSGHDLDVSWPTFARLGGGGGMGWRRPSSALSFSSLYSHTSQLSEAVGFQSPTSTTMSPVDEDNPLAHPDAMEGEEESGPEVVYLQQRLATLEGDNALLRSSCAALQAQLDQVKAPEEASSSVEGDGQTDSRCDGCVRLTEELSMRRTECEDLLRLKEQLEGQVTTLEAQLQHSQSQENDLKNEINLLQEKLNETHITSRKLDSCEASETETNTVPDIPLVTAIPQQSGVPDNVMVNVTSVSSAQEMLEQCQSKLRELEEENRLLKEQCSAAETEKTILRTNIRKINEAEEKLRQKVESLSQREHDHECLQEEVDCLKEQLEERGRLLHISSGRVTELEALVKVQEAKFDDANDQQKRSQKLLSEIEGVHNELNKEYQQLKKEVETLHVQIADLRFQMSSKDMERDAAIKADEEKTKALSAAALQISEQEAKICHLEQQAVTDKELWQSEQEKLSSTVKKLKEDLEEKDADYSSLQRQLEQIVAKVDVANNSLTETQSELKSTQEASTQLTSDNEQLREKIIQLLREKDTLWQANMRLEAVAGGSRAWMENKSAQSCLLCGVAFSLTKRRHHCRSCGRIFCTGCSDNWIMTPASSRRVRVCDDCFSVQAELAAIVATVSNTTTLSMHPSDEGMEQGASGPQVASPAKPLPIASAVPNDDDFAVISDDEVQSSKLSSTPSSDSLPSNPELVPEARATADIITTATLASQPPTNCEAWVAAGTRSLVPVELPAGVSLQWSFVSEPKCVSFSVLHQPPLSGNPESGEAEHSPSQQRVLIPTRRVASTQGSTVKGKLVTKQPGVYTLVFDNSSSRYTAKRITYSLQLLQQTEGDSSTQQQQPSHPSSAGP